MERLNSEGELVGEMDRMFIRRLGIDELRFPQSPLRSRQEGKSSPD